MSWRVLLGVGSVVIVVVGALIAVLTITSSAPAGYDVSYPQCSGAYPSNALFGIVGVNGGLANNANSCVADELRWALRTPGQTRQPRLSLYIDTGNPGAHVADWPRHGTTPAYGACNGRLTNACSYLYGAQRAARSYRIVAAVDLGGAKSAPWWLDVELTASWAQTYQLNIAALAGFIAGLRKAGVVAAVGIYSTAAQWKDITGLTAQTTAAGFDAQLPDWVAGTEASLSQARGNCARGGFTGEAPTLAQYRIGASDADLRCSDRR